MIRSVYICLVFLFTLPSCAQRKSIKGEYLQTDYHYQLPHIVHLNSDSTGYYTWWTDIQMKNEGTWTVSNDTIIFTDESYLHAENRAFVFDNNKLVDEKGRIYKRLSAFQRRKVYRGR